MSEPPQNTTVREAEQSSVPFPSLSASSAKMFSTPYLHPNHLLNETQNVNLRGPQVVELLKGRLPVDLLGVMGINATAPTAVKCRALYGWQSTSGSPPARETAHRRQFSARLRPATQ